MRRSFRRCRNRPELGEDEKTTCSTIVLHDRFSSQLFSRFFMLNPILAATPSPAKGERSSKPQNNCSSTIACEAPTEVSATHHLPPSTAFSVCFPMAPVSTSTAARAAGRLSNAQSTARLSQIRRQFSSSVPARKEIQDAYILSAARTPTGKVDT